MLQHLFELHSEYLHQRIEYHYVLHMLQVNKKQHNLFSQQKKQQWNLFQPGMILAIVENPYE